MKAFRFTLFVAVLALLMPLTGVKASVAVPASASRTELMNKVNSKADVKTTKFQKSFVAKKVSKMIAKRLAKSKAGGNIDLADPVEKWMWFWIFGWGAGLLFYIIAAASVLTTGFGIFGLLGLLCTLFGTISLVIWIVKKFGGA